MLPSTIRKPATCTSSQKTVMHAQCSRFVFSLCVFTCATHALKPDDLAATSFDNAADCFLKYGSKYDAATEYINAANVLRKSNLNKCVNYTQRAVDLLAEEGRFSIAAKHVKDMAEVCEQENNLDLAIDNYKRAAEFYEGENSKASANQCQLKVALISAQLERYEQAFEIYESISREAVDDRLLKFSVKDWLFRAGLCRIAYVISSLFVFFVC
jgi:alpha-soluble NSF attachment protein